MRGVSPKNARMAEEELMTMPMEGYLVLDATKPVRRQRRKEADID